MAKRHRIPTIFNLSMVDVLCCALGCVILLWLLNLREAKQRTESAGQISELLAQTKAKLDETDLARAAALTSAETADRERAATEAARQAMNQELQAANVRLATLNKSLQDLQGQYAANADRLAKKTKEQLDLSKQLAAAQQRIDELDVLVRDKETKVKAAARSADDLAERLRDLDARLKDARATAGQVPGLKNEVRSAQEKLTRAEASVAALLEDKRSLTDQANRARAAAENRFAGIALTGRRVVFLVDMSGSMELVDENTEAKEKWSGVRETLTKIMRSLPDLEKFQVILFATNVSYLLANENRWLDYDPVTSSATVAEALAKIKPKGNTDMYKAFQAAFRFRDAGLDTIYLFSDGLPNVGYPLTAEQTRTLKETERSEILSKYIRRTLKTDWNRSVPGRDRVRINAVGFFYESPDVGAFLWALAREHDGSFVGMSKP
jgi:hypothetical protein